jgi:hypothetical protein
MFLLPSVLAIYAKRNTSLKTLSVRGIIEVGFPSTSTTPSILEPIRDGTVTYVARSLEPFFAGIVGLPDLKRLEIYE